MGTCKGLLSYFVTYQVPVVRFGVVVTILALNLVKLLEDVAKTEYLMGQKYFYLQIAPQQNMTFIRAIRRQKLYSI